MAKNLTKLKKLEMTSVDLVRAGANQEADICLYKSADPQEPTEQPTEHEKNIFKRFLAWMGASLTETEDAPDNPIEKADEQPAPEEVYKSAIIESIQSIAADESLSADERVDMIEKSLEQFHVAMDALEIPEGDPEDYSYLTDDLEKSDSDDPDEIEKYNHNHDSLGRFASSSGGGGGRATSGGGRTTSGGGKGKMSDKDMMSIAHNRFPGLSGRKDLNAHDSDDEDFFDASVWGIAGAISDAYKAGGGKKISDKEALRIAQNNCPALEGRKDLKGHDSDSEDFFDASVWGIKGAINEAYALGQKSSDKTTKKSLDYDEIEIL